MPCSRSNTSQELWVHSVSAVHFEPCNTDTLIEIVRAECITCLHASDCDNPCPFRSLPVHFCEVLDAPSVHGDDVVLRHRIEAGNSASVDVSAKPLPSSGLLITTLALENDPCIRDQPLLSPNLGSCEDIFYPALKAKVPISPLLEWLCCSGSYSALCCARDRMAQIRASRYRVTTSCTQYSLSKISRSLELSSRSSSSMRIHPALCGLLISDPARQNCGLRTRL